MQPLCGCLCKIKGSYKATSLKSGCNFSSKHFLIEKKALIFWKILCDELLLWFNFSLFLLLENQNNFTFISRKKRKGIGKMGIGRKSWSLHSLASEMDSYISIFLVNIQVRNNRQSWGEGGACVCDFGDFHSDWLKTFLIRVKESRDFLQRIFSLV